MSDDLITDATEPDLLDEEAPVDVESEEDLEAVAEPDGSEADRLDQLTSAPLDAAEDEYRR